MRRLKGKQKKLRRKNMRPEIRSMEGIVLRAGKGREGGRLVSVFTRKMGFLRLGVSRQALSRYGTGLMLPAPAVNFTT